MRYTQIVAISVVAAFSLGTLACETRRERRQRERKKWKRKHKRWKKNRFGMRRGMWRGMRGMGPRMRVNLPVFIGDKTDVYLAKLPLKVGMPKAAAEATLGPELKMKFGTRQGRGVVKAEIGADGKISMLKLKLFRIPEAQIVSLATAKWGPPTETKTDRRIWKKPEAKVQIILKNQSAGHPQPRFTFVFKPLVAAAGGMAAPAMMPAAPAAMK